MAQITPIELPIAPEWHLPVPSNGEVLTLLIADKHSYSMLWVIMRAQEAGYAFELNREVMHRAWRIDYTLRNGG